MTSAFVSVIPKRIPKRYQTHRDRRFSPLSVVSASTISCAFMFIWLEKHRKEEVRRDQTASEESYDREQRGELKIRQPRNRVSRCAAPRICGAEAHQKPTNNHRDKPPDGEQGPPTDQFTRDQAGEVVYTERRQSGPGVLRNGNFLRPQKSHAHKAAHGNAEHKHQIH